MLAVRKHFRLVRQIGPAGVDKVDAGQAVFGGDFLRAQMLLDRHRIVGAALDRRIVRHDHRFTAVYEPDPCNETRAMHVALVHAVGGERADFQKRRTRVDETGDALASQELATRHMTLTRLGRAAFGGRAAAGLQFIDDPAPTGDIRLVLR